MRVHSGVLPYPCEFPGCTKRFRWKSSLKPHVKVHLAAGYTLNSSPCSSANFGISKAKKSGALMPQEENSRTTVRLNNPVTPAGKAVFRGALLSLPSQNFLTETPRDADCSPTAVMDSSFFESSVTPGNVPHSRQYYCTFAGCGEKFNRMSHLLEHEILVSHQGSRPQVARVLFQDSHNQKECANENEIDLTCDSVLSDSQASYETDVVSFTLDSHVEDASGVFDGVSITEDLWKNDLTIMDPFMDLSINFGAGNKVMDVLSSAECSSGVSEMNTEEGVSLTEPQWMLPSTGSTTSTADFTASLYIQ